MRPECCDAIKIVSFPAFANSPVESEITLDIVKRFIDQILNSNAKHIENLAGNSFDHQNGFRRLTLEQYGDESCGAKLRLHAWNIFNAGFGGSEMIHSHSWDFLSRVLHGNLRVEHWSVGASAEDLRAVVGKLIRMPNRLSANSGISCQTIRNVCFAEQTGEQIFETGNAHYGTAEGFHRVGPQLPSSPLLTFVHQGFHRRSFSEVFTEDQTFKPLAVASLSSIDYISSLQIINDLI